MNAIRIFILALLLMGCGTSPVPPGITPTPSASASESSPPLADACHQGATVLCVLNPAVTQATIGQTVCRRGWTATVRPPVAWTDALKRQQMLQEGLAGPASAYEEDHRMPLELGGAPKDTMNLSPEAGTSPNPKDHDEDALHSLVCSGKVGLVMAQVQLAGKWLGAYPGYRQ